MVIKRKGKKKTVVMEEEKEEEQLKSEDWCFVCKDGGSKMRICDRKQCEKPYHPSCVKKDDSFLEADDYWVCDWHACSHCRRPSYCHCYTCPNSVCDRCLPSEDFVQVKEMYGFCDECLEYASLIERKKDCNSDGEMVDFTDRDSVEGLFKEYYDIIKKENGLEAKDVYAAEESLKTKKEHQSDSGSEEYNEKCDEEEDNISDCDVSEHVKKNKRLRKERGSEREKSESKKSRNNVFIGWASRSLFEFLTSIGKSTNEKLSQDDVTSIIIEYVEEHKLLHQKKRNRIICDARLRSLFRRKAIKRRNIYELLDAHFVENYDEPEEDEFGYDSNDEGACKRQRKVDSEDKSPKMEMEDSVRLSCFASVIVENIKLVYLKKSLLVKLLEQPETFEEKVTGSFVRIKSDSNDIRAKNSYQLVQVEGVKEISGGENNTQFVLKVSDTPKSISIDLLSDVDFSEEECEDLRQKMVSGQLKRPTVGDLQQKANILHEDLTNYRIKRELKLLERRIDQANEKGWRQDLREYREKRKKLQTPSEQLKLLADIPQVIPDVHEQLDSSSGDKTNGMNSNKGSPQSILQCNSSVPKIGLQDNKAYDNKFDDLESAKWCIRGPAGERDKGSLLVLKRWSEKSTYASKFKVWREDEDEEKAIWLQEAMSYAFPKK